MNETCATCAYFRAAQMKGRGNCFFNPPVVQFMPQMVAAEAPKFALPNKAGGAVAQEAMQIVPFSAVPLVRADDFCHNHKHANGTMQ